MVHSQKGYHSLNLNIFHLICILMPKILYNFNIIWLVSNSRESKKRGTKEKVKKTTLFAILKTVSNPIICCLIYGQSIYLLSRRKNTLREGREAANVAALADGGWGGDWSQFLTTEQKAWSSFLLLRYKKGVTCRNCGKVMNPLPSLSTWEVIQSASWNEHGSSNEDRWNKQRLKCQICLVFCRGPAEGRKQNQRQRRQKAENID